MEWQPIDTAPKDGTVVYVWLSVKLNKYAAFDFNMKLAQWLADAGEWRIEGVGGNVPQRPTHWMPLPSPPKGTE